MTTYKIVAATGCPTGIAHTYMAQEALEQAAKRKGIAIKVETHGQVGIENQLTPEEIKNADAVIIAADKDVQAERFAGKRVINVPVSKGIKDADQLIEEALRGSLIAENKTVDALEQADGGMAAGIGHSIYKNLMNGVSHMLPFVVAGGVIIAVSFAIWGVYSFDPNDPTYNPTSAMLKGIGDTAMGMMVPILAAYIAEGIARRDLCWILSWVLYSVLAKSHERITETIRWIEGYFLISSDWCFSHWCGDVFVSKPDGGDQSRYDGFLGRIPEFESIDFRHHCWLYVRI